MESGRHTARSIVELYLERIAALNRVGPALCRDRGESRRPRHRRSSRRRAKSGGPRGPMHGIPVLIKDNIDTADRMTTTAGSLALDGVDRRRATRSSSSGCATPERDPRQDEPERMGQLPLDPLDQRLERARRPARNPYALDRNPMRFELGTGAGVAANLRGRRHRHGDGRLDHLARSSVQGLVGIKPTVGLVSRAGDHSDRAQPGYRGPDVPHGGRRGRAARPSGWRRIPRDPATAREQRTCGDRLYERFSIPAGLRGRPARRCTGSTFGIARGCAANRERNALPCSLGRRGRNHRRSGRDHIGGQTCGDSEVEVLMYEFKAGLQCLPRGDSFDSHRSVHCRRHRVQRCARAGGVGQPPSGGAGRGRKGR